MLSSFIKYAGLVLALVSNGYAHADKAVPRCNPAADASRIAVAGGSITEIVFALGEQHRLTAVDRTSNFPAAATRLPQVGYVRNLSAEGMLSLAPTLVLGEDDMGPVEVVEQLAQTGVDVRRLGEQHDARGILNKVNCVAAILAVPDAQTEQVRQDLQAKVAALEAIDRSNKPRVALLLSLSDGVPTAAGADTSGDGVIDMAGGHNVFAHFTGWKPVSLEAMAEADPHFIVMPERGLQTSGGMRSVLSHPAVRLTTAGRNGRVVVLDGMSLLGFGPRTLDAARMLADELGNR